MRAEMADTSIEWTRNADGTTGKVWNPTTGCDRISAGCDHCYALTMAKRLKGMGQAKYQNDGDPRTSGPGFGLTVHPDALTIPFRWRAPQRVFVNSMSDIGHARIPAEFAAQVWAVMAATPRHTYQILTKRPQRLRRMLSSPAFAEQVQAAAAADVPWPLPNVWVGSTIELDRYARRADEVRETPAAVRWLSLEPLLGPLPSLDLPGIGWAVLGGESGAGARPMDLGWVRELVGRCREAATAVFVKQLGSVWAQAHQADPKGGNWAAWPADLHVREFPVARHPSLEPEQENEL